MGGGPHLLVMHYGIIFLLKALCAKPTKEVDFDVLRPYKVKSLMQNPFDVNILLWPCNHLVENWKKP